jgi:hypothetical protein
VIKYSVDDQIAPSYTSPFVPTKTPCVRCKKTGFVRVEHVIKADTAERHFYCGACDHTWQVVADGHPTSAASDDQSLRQQRSRQRP